MALEHENRSSAVVATNAVFTVIAGIFVIARLVARIGFLRIGGFDELAIVISMVRYWTSYTASSRDSISAN